MLARTPLDFCRRILNICPEATVDAKAEEILSVGEMAEDVMARLYISFTRS